MAGMWLTTLVIFGFLLIGIVFTILGLGAITDTHDAVKIDPLPDDDSTSSKE
ncbi:hypothetical protein [Bacillus sp. PS06]|uniref:hypothetical protein n=1 Tax=Bacillus sp. PS06 TaxID=2764176 RepID=UPI00177E2198|nr:hypothetical protein [Bacillus sp. PS06]MBD8069931.1 hypothetical protein [Bacillus sp. PS06]